jgi:hypothetical protein
MNKKQLKRILQQHGIGYRVVNRRIIAQDQYSHQGKAGYADVDVTDFSLGQLGEWLGY